MKTYLLITSLSLCSLSIATARIGENQTEITAKFGPGEKAPKTHLTGTKQFSYNHENRSISVMYLNGKSVMEIIRCAKPGISDEDIKKILAENGEGKEWQPEKEAKAWLRSDGKIKIFRSPLHPEKVLFLQDVAVAKEIAAKEKADKDKAAQEKAAQEKAAQEKAAQEKAAQEKAAQEKVAQEKATREKAAREKAAREKAAQEKAANDQTSKGAAGSEKPAPVEKPAPANKPAGTAGTDKSSSGS